jgi:protein-S-isoprenylcysteine O-methyltransferase Ste14
MLGLLMVKREVWQFRVQTFQFDHLSECLLLPLFAIDGAITGAFGSRGHDLKNQPSYRNLLSWANPLFIVLYVGCAALCERLKVGMIPSEFVRYLGLVLFVTGLAIRVWSQMTTPSALLHVRRQLEKMAAMAGEAKAEPKSDQTHAESQVSESVAADAPPSSSEDPTPATPVPAAGLEPFPSGPHRLVRHPDSSGRLLTLVGLPLCFGAWLPLLAVPGIIVLLKWHIADQEAFRISQLGNPYVEYRKGTWNIIPFIY